MKKVLNDPLKAADELFDGLVDYYGDSCRKVGTRSIVKNDIPDGKVTVVIGGGAGHEPIYHGLVGTNLADAAACGDIFAAPAPNIILEATQAVDKGNGVLFLYGNYAGDNMNFDVAAEQAEASGSVIRTVRIADDVASAPPNRKEDRRGIAGLVPIVKLSCAASQTAENIEELVAISELACRETKSIGASFAPGSIPATGKPTFTLEPGRVGLGMGIHGEQGIDEFDFQSADHLADHMLDFLLKDFQEDSETREIESGDSVVLVINSLGSTTMMELLVLLRRIKTRLNEINVTIKDSAVGSFVTCQEMAGVSISITRMDDTLAPLWEMPCESLCYSKLGNNTPVSSRAKTPSRQITNTVAKTKNAQQEETNAPTFAPSATGLDLPASKQLLKKVADAIIAAESMLGDADRALGDGDHGLGMKRGFTALKERIESTPSANIGELFAIAGDALLTTMGGASGVIFSTFFSTAGKQLSNSTYLGNNELAAVLPASVETIMKRGGAKAGEKTMLDALIPAAEKAQKVQDQSIQLGLAEIASAAEQGVEDTKAMLATKGRAKSLGKRSIGLPDAGAISTALIFRTMSDFVANQ